MSREKVIYNGRLMAAEWPAKIEAAQQLTHYAVNGQKFARIRFGDEDSKWGAKPCLNCAVIKGQSHIPNCEYETCPTCGSSRAGQCHCKIAEFTEKKEPLDGAPTNKKGLQRLNIWSWIFVIICLLILGRSILMLFGI